jgi:PAS domain S-box-containing protein
MNIKQSLSEFFNSKNSLKSMKSLVERGNVEYSFDRDKLDLAHSELQSIAHETSSLAKVVGQSIDEKLNDSEIRLGKILSAIEDFILVKDGEGKWKLLNTYGCKLLSLEKADYLDKTDDDIIKLRPELSKALSNCKRTDELTWNQSKARREEETFFTCEGIIYFDVIKTPTFDEYGNRKELIIIGRDITSVKERQKRMKAAYTALNVSNDLISIADSNGNLVFVNDKFIDAYEYPSHVDVIGKNMTVIKNGVPPAEYQSMWEHISKNKMWHGVLINKTQTGKSLKVDTTILPIKNGVPKPVFYVCKQTVIN